MNKELGTEAIIWHLEDLYTSPNDPNIKEDMEFAKEEASSLEETFKGRIGDLNPEEMLQLVKRMEKASERLAQVASFAQLNFATDCTSHEKSAFLQKIREEETNIQRHLVFFEIEWQKVPEDKAKEVLEAPAIRDYAHYLSFIRRFAPHTLTEAEEKLLLEISPVGRSSWITLFEKVLAHMRFGEKKRTQEEVLSDLYARDRATRENAHAEFTQGLLTQEHVLCHCFNTVLQDKAIEDRVRKYPSWISSMNLSNELHDETVETLITAVTNHYDIVHEYYHKKRKILGVEKLYDFDRYAPIEGMPDEIVPWEECKQIVLDAYYGFSKEMGEIGSLFFDKGWIHAPVVPGKTSGAFAHPTVPSSHPFLLVNYTGRLRDVETVAHELGHGIHQYLSRQVGYFNSHTPLPLAETASVFGEMLVFKALLSKQDSSKAKRALICEKLESIFATVFRQVTMNRFEDAIHTFRREKGELSPDDFKELWLKTQSAMFGDSVELTDEYGHWWSYISHFVHAPGYVYSYAFGELLVLSLFRAYEEGMEGYVEKYVELLSKGGKEDPYSMLKPFGFNLNDTSFWEKGLNMIKELVDEVETK